MKQYWFAVLCGLILVFSSVILIVARSFSPHIVRSANPAPRDAKHADLAASAPLPPRPGPTVRVPILMYHHVGDVPTDANAIRRDLTVSTDDFSRQVQWLHDQGYTSMTLVGLYQAIATHSGLPAKPIVFTFDDGYTDVFDNAVPILKKYGYTGSFAIITQFPGRADYASWDQLRAAQAEGMEMVSHTQDHFDGSNIIKYSPEYIKADLGGARDDLQRELGHPVNILVYPYGHYTPEYVKIAASMGYVMGLTVHFGREVNVQDLMEVPRVRVHGHEDFEVFKKILSGK